MKPPRLPGTEKFRFSDKKFAEQHGNKSLADAIHEQLDSVQHDTIDKRLAAPPTPTTDTGTVADDRPTSLSRQCSFASGHFESSPELRRCDSNDSLSSTTTKSSEIYCALVGELAQLRLAHDAKRKPQLPISCRQLTARLFTLSSLVHHESPQSCTSSSTVNNISKTLSTKAGPTSVQSFARRRIASRVRQLKSMLNSTLRPSVSDTSATQQQQHAHQQQKQAQQSQTQSPVSSTINEQDVILACAPSRASLISVDDVQSMCTRTSDDFSSIRSGTSSPEMTTPSQHWAKKASLDLQTPRHRLSTSSHSSWDDDSLGT